MQIGKFFDASSSRKEKGNLLAPPPPSAFPFAELYVSLWGEEEKERKVEGAACGYSEFNECECEYENECRLAREGGTERESGREGKKCRGRGA